ncbi:MULTISPECIES: dihydrodipicolinate reductase C-terminal domain-containing protein [Holospora]|uniref:4-hydroxy-tetrahydrodipicolinate reductase n=2 Tax=Holospora TaxID=44747 RepID=A0A061JI00_9PROT|nr:MULTISPECIES: dihydrodipicolinate reductase C-terminal domain-containing protein [Holospora]ETZ05147.1 4-hydroxy-tetrahydrodipicolinate reductase [Holospora undulata HU1]GAJ46798.1 4-hydroxy-tetrahydrodipicolinate reductase [Holospora elegans E1]
MRLGVFGGLGKLGKAIVDLAKDYSGISEVFIKDFKQEGDLTLSLKDFIEGSDVIIDVAGAKGTQSLLQGLACYEDGEYSKKSLKKSLVIGSTGHESDVNHMVCGILGFCSVLYAPNAAQSLWNFLYSATQLAQALGPDWDVHVHEHHHKNKKDAPSGTALCFTQHLESACPWLKNKIHWSCIRAGSGMILNSLIFSGNDEVIHCTHQVLDRSVFAKGLLDMAVWIKERDPGYYDVGYYVKNKGSKP